MVLQKQKIHILLVGWFMGVLIYSTQLGWHDIFRIILMCIGVSAFVDHASQWITKVPKCEKLPLLETTFVHRKQRPET